MLDNDCVFLAPCTLVNAAKEIYVNNFPWRLIASRQIDSAFKNLFCILIFIQEWKMLILTIGTCLKMQFIEIKMSWDEVTFLKQVLFSPHSYII